MAPKPLLQYLEAQRGTSFRLLVPNETEMTSAPVLSASDICLTRSDSKIAPTLGNVLPTHTRALGAMVRATPATNVPWPA